METYFSPDDLAQVKRLGSLFTPPRDVAIMLGQDPEYFSTACRLRHFSPDVYDAYWSGFLEQEMLIRNSAIRLALQGSVPALKDTIGFIGNTRAKILER